MIDFEDPGVQAALLGRRPSTILTDPDRVVFSGQRVLITGAGGSVGSVLARQIAACGPKHLALFDNGEHGLFRVERQIAEEYPDVPVEPFLADITRARALRLACRGAQPDVIFHAAAYKHVTMAERAVCAAVATNVLGTQQVTRAALEVGARLVLISTDKAAEPRSVMGATKRLAELVTFGLTPAHLRPIAVRFGNVLGSSGSVTELMADRLCRGRSLQVTDARATRFFMTTLEAVSLVMASDVIGRARSIYWLDVGKPVNILDLANRLNLLGTRVGLGPVPLDLTGLRPGEKLREEFRAQGLGFTRAGDGRIWVARQPAIDPEATWRVIVKLAAAVARGDARAALAGLCAAVPEYKPSRHVLDLASQDDEVPDRSVGTDPTIARPA